MEITRHAPLPRRGFLGRFLAANTALLIPGVARGQRDAAPADEAWLALLTGRHRQIFDAPGLQSGKPLVQARNF